MQQRTIKTAASVSGIGLHTGQQATMTFKPAPANHGFKFQRTDLEDAPVIPASVKHVISTNRGTTLKVGDATVSTVEHALSALAGLEIDNVLIEIDGPEAPILDGSAIEFVKALEAAGIEEQEAEKEYFAIREPVFYKDTESGSELMILPADGFEVTTLIDFNSKTVGAQFAQLEGIADYKEQIAPCRTFCFLHEIEQLIDQGLIKGGHLDNAIVFVEGILSEEERKHLAQKLDKPEIKVESTGILNTASLRFQNEAARHKLLDVIGDLTLVGKPIRGKIIATKPGHRANVEFAKLLRQQYIENRKLQGIPQYNPNTQPLFDVTKIASWLPHRFPFLLVDKIIELSESHVVGIKNITFDEYFFQGHFPGNPIFPGVLQIEALAQTGGILALSLQEDPSDWDTYFLKIDNTKFKAKVLPGDTLVLKMELLAPIRRGIVQMRGIAYVGNKIVSEGDLTAQIVKRSG